MPELDYVEQPHQQTFSTDGGTFSHFAKYGFSLTVPPLAVPEGKEIRLSIGLCCYGPFSISDKYFLASDFAVIVADSKFDKPVRVVMDHCLILPEYKKCNDVLMLKANHLKMSNKLYTFDRFIIPEVSSNSATLSFETEDFCILCAVLAKTELHTSSSSFSSTSSVPQSLGHIDDDNPSSASSSFDVPLSRALSSESHPSQVVRALSAPESSPPSRKRKSDSLEDEPFAAASPEKPSSRKIAMKRAHQLEQSRDKKKFCGIEYSALLFQPKRRTLESPDDQYKFIIFVCINCSGAHKVSSSRYSYSEAFCQPPSKGCLLT